MEHEPDSGCLSAVHEMRRRSGRADAPSTARTSPRWCSVTVVTQLRVFSGYIRRAQVTPGALLPSLHPPARTFLRSHLRGRERLFRLQTSPTHAAFRTSPQGMFLRAGRALARASRGRSLRHTVQSVIRDVWGIPPPCAVPSFTRPRLRSSRSPPPRRYRHAPLASVAQVSSAHSSW